MNGFRLGLESPEQADVVALIEALDAMQIALYPAESNHFLDVSTLAQPHVRFAVARDERGQAIGCVAVVLNAGYGEIKRMFVRPELRGRGIARALLAFVEQAAARDGCREFALETGISQPEAIALYERAGYLRCGPFGDYAEDPLSLFMRKRLG